MRVALSLNAFEGLLFTFDDMETIHGDKHDKSSVINIRITRRITKRLDQKLVKPKVFLIAKQCNTNHHILMPIGRLIPVGSKQTVPPRRIETVISVGFVRPDGVMNAVHIGRHNYPPQ
jgi:hypothetical protein